MTRLGDKLPVPPIPPERLARLERGVVSQLALASAARPGWRHRLRFAPALVATAAVAAALVLALRPSHAPLAIAPAAPPLVVTGPGEHARVELGDAVIEIGERTRVAIGRGSDGSVRLGLGGGRVDCDVTPRPHRPPFLVVAGDTTVTVVGTAFSVERDREVRVAVVRGTVHVSRGELEVAVTAGQAWSAGRGVELAGASAVGPSAAASGAAASHGATLPAGGTTIASTALGLHGDGASPPLGAHVAHAPNLAASHGGEPDAGAAPGDAPHARELGQARPPRGVAPSDDDGTLASLIELEHDDARAAARRYRAIALARTGDPASFALYSLAYLQYYRLGDRDEALRTAREYEKRFPRGREAESVAWLRITALCAEGALEDCRAAAHTYLDHFPAGAHRELAGKITNW